MVEAGEGGGGGEGGQEQGLPHLVICAAWWRQVRGEEGGGGQKQGLSHLVTCVAWWRQLRWWCWEEVVARNSK